MEAKKEAVRHITVPYQRCPLCDGTGRVLADGCTSSLYQTCKVCNGSMIILQAIVPTPNINKI